MYKICLEILAAATLVGFYFISFYVLFVSELLATAALVKKHASTSNKFRYRLI